MSGRRARRERASQASRPRQPSRRRRQLALAAVLVLVAVSAALAIALTRTSSPTASAGEAPAVRGGSATAPLQLSGTDPVTGKPVSLASYPGEPIVLNMWASWCTGCYAEARALATFERTHPQAQVIGVDIQDTKTAAKAFYRRFGWRHPSIFDRNGLIATRFQLQGLPATLFLNRQHRVVAKILGETNLAGFEAGYRQATA